MTSNPQARLAWLEQNQPRNLSAINSLRSQLGLPAIQAPPPKPKRVFTAKPKPKQTTLYPFSKGYVQRQMRNVTIHY
jgi:hypothetical protein